MIQVYQYKLPPAAKGLFVCSIWEEGEKSARRGRRELQSPAITAAEVAGPCAEAEQIHGSTIVEVQSPGRYPACDGLLTNRPGLPLVIRTADCAAVVLYHPQKKWLVNLHAGWRGARGGIHTDGLKRLIEKSGGTPAEIVAIVSPAIHACCYRVGNEFKEYFGTNYLPERHERLYFDLPKYILDSLTKAGLPESQIVAAEECTFCSEQNFPSYRRNKTRNRLYTVAKIEED